MNPMLLGETLVGGSSDVTYEGFWMPAGGNDGVAAVEVYRVSDASQVTVKMETKSSDGTDTSPPPTEIGSVIINSTNPGIFKFDVDDAQDLVRYVIELTAGNSVHFQFTQPLWAPN